MRPTSTPDPSPRVRIAAPVSAAEEVEPLVASGADELYCGFVPAEWIDRYSYAVWLNRRSPGRANLSSPGALRRLVDRAHDLGVPVAVTLNAPCYTGDQLPGVVSLAGRLYATGVDALIIADVGLILALRELEMNIDLHVSSVAGVRNGGAARFFAGLGVQRIILPRHLTVAEIAAIRSALLGVGLEAFALNDGCVFEEAFCSTTHAVGSFCTAPWRHGCHRLDGAPLAPDDADALRANLGAYERWVGQVNHCGGARPDRDTPSGPCGLCAVPDLSAASVAALKVVGRESTLRRKQRSVEQVRAVRDLACAGAARAEVCALARRLRDDAGRCDVGDACYYRPPPLGAAG